MIHHYWKLIRAAVTALLVVSSWQAQAVTVKDYGSLPQTQMVAISPNGELIAFRKVTDSNDQVMVVSLAQHKQLLAVDVSRIKPKGIYFFNNELIHLRVSNYMGLDGYNEKFDISTSFVLNLNDRSIRQLLIPGDQIFTGQQGLGRVVGLAPNGEFGYMPAFTKDDSPYPKYSLLKVNLKEKASHKVIMEGKTGANDFFLDAEGNVIAQETFDDQKNIHKLFARKANEWQEIFREETAIRSKAFVGLTPDYQSLVMLETNQTSGRVAYYTLGLSDGVIKGPLLERDDADIEGVVTDMQRVVKGVQYGGLLPSYKFFDNKLDARFQEIVKKFPEHSVSLTDWSPDSRFLVVYVEGSNFAGDYFLFSPDKEPVFLTSSRPQFKPEDINPIGKINYTARDNLKIPTLLTIPRANLNAMKNLPAIIMPHGGPEAHDTIGFDWLAQSFANRGYLVIQPQFRGSDGFGLAHTKAGFGEWGKKMQDDLTDGVNFFVKKGMVDPKRICIVGASYGGYAALAGGAFTPDLYKCVVSINGIGDINSMLDWEKRYRGKDNWVVTYMERQFANGKINDKELAAISPENSAANFQAPVLLVHSVNDKIVPIKQSESMKKALVKAQKTVELIELEGDDHSLSGQVTRQKAVEISINFVDKFLH